MADQMTSYDVITNKKWYQLVEEAQGYLINVNLFRCALTGRKHKGVFHQPSSLYNVGARVSLYVQGLTNFVLQVTLICDTYRYLNLHVQQNKFFGKVLILL